MKTDDLKIQLCIAIPFDRPTRNGVVFTREAVEKAVEDFQSPLPIVLHGGYKDGSCVGHTIGETTSALWNEESKVCEIITNGVVYQGGADLIVNEMKDGVITDFRVASVGITKW